MEGDIHMASLADIGLIGIAVMGENLALNLASKGFHVVVSSRHQNTIDTFLKGRAKDKTITGTTDYKALVKQLKQPRKILLMIKAGPPVDEVIEQLIPLLDPNDIIIDGGNSNYEDTTRRSKQLEEKELLYVGMGVSGGEEGALTGPSMMPGGHIKAWPHIKPIFEMIAASVDDTPCVDWMGEAGSGHFVKMVHNGIEYGDMQLIAESYHLMKDLLNLDNDRIATHFKTWNEAELESYLMEITANIFKYQNENGVYVIDTILDHAGQKGTGKWAVAASLDYGVPLTLISESVFARFLSSLKADRMTAEGIYKHDKPMPFIKPEFFLDHLRKALYAAKILSYAQGFHLMHEAASVEEWNLNFEGIATIWRGGCIIRSAFLNDIKKAYQKNPQLKHLLLDSHFIKIMKETIPSLREVVMAAVEYRVPVPALSSALAYFDGYSTGRLPANLIQAQRDYFGAHTYELLKGPKDEFHHTDWTGTGGKTTSTTYEK